VNRLSLAFFAIALLLVAVAGAAMVHRAGVFRLDPTPAAAESVAIPSPGPAARS
jgi:hypothetical protein